MNDTQEYMKRGGKRRPKAKAKATQNVNVVVKNVMRNDRTMIYPNSYLKQMEHSQNTGRQNLFSGPPLQYASPPQVMYISHPNVNRPSISDEIGIGTNPIPNRHSISILDDNINQPIITPVNPDDITQRIPDKRMVPSTQTMPAFSITSNNGVSPTMRGNPMMGGPIPHMHSAGEDMIPEPVQMRAEPSVPSEAGLRSQLFGQVEMLKQQENMFYNLRDQGIRQNRIEGQRKRHARSKERDPSIVPRQNLAREFTPFGDWMKK